MILSKESTWPSELVELLRENENLIQSYMREEHRRLHDDRRDGQYIPTAFRGSNQFASDWQAFLPEIHTTLQGTYITGFHCTRLTDDEVAVIAARGMSLPSPEMLRERICDRLKADELSEDIAERLLRENRAADDNRPNKLWFCFTPSLLEIESGVRPLFCHWGGEALYGQHENDSEIGPILRKIGQPRIVVAEIPFAYLATPALLAEIVAGRYISVRDGAFDANIDFTCWIEKPIENDRICEIINRYDSAFEQLTGCSRWLQPLS